MYGSGPATGIVLTTHKKNRDSGPRGCFNPTGPQKSYDPQEPLVPKRVTKGGSYLCSEEYCSNYRPSARMATAYDFRSGNTLVFVVW